MPASYAVTEHEALARYLLLNLLQLPNVETFVPANVYEDLDAPIEFQ